MKALLFKNFSSDDFYDFSQSVFCSSWEIILYEIASEIGKVSSESGTNGAEAILNYANHLHRGN